MLLHRYMYLAITELIQGCYVLTLYRSAEPMNFKYARRYYVNAVRGLLCQDCIAEDLKLLIQMIIRLYNSLVYSVTILEIVLDCDIWLNPFL